MGYIDDALDEVKRATPTSGVNVCIYDDFEDVGDKLETIGNYDTVEEAQNFIDNYDGDAELVMYEAEVYEAEEEGTSDGAKKGWLSRQQGGKSKLNTRLPSYTPQKNHSISNYISMAEDDYEKGTTRDNNEYEKMNYRSDSKFNAPHRTIYEEKLNNNDKYDEFIEDNFNFEDDYGLARGWDCKRCGKAFEEDESYLLVDHAKTHGITIYGMDSLEEKLNKDGTGVKRATRGLNPKKTKAKSLTFIYVSKSECDICRQYDGKTFATDSPDRPIIPRLESQGKKGTRPYTHPNCKCKWVKPFSDAYMKNFDEIGMKDSDNINFLKTSNETYDSVKASLYNYAYKKYGKKFDKLPKSRKHYILMQELMRKLKTEETLYPTSLSIVNETYNEIQPTLALQLAKMSHRDSNEVRSLIDDMVGESLTSERKHEIVLEHNLDFTFENLLDLTAVALFEALNEEEKIGMDVELEFTDDEEKAKDTVEDHLEEDPEHYSRLKSVFEHDVWDEEKNKLVDPSLLEDKEESVNESFHDYFDYEEDDTIVCTLCKKQFQPHTFGQKEAADHLYWEHDTNDPWEMNESKATEDMIYDENGVWQPKPEERMFTNGSIMALQSHFEELEGYKSHEGGVTLCKICNNLFDTYSKFSDHYQTHSKKEQGMERDHSKASESNSSDYYGTYNIDGGAREDNYYYLYCLHCDKKVYINHDVKGSYDEMDEHVKVHFEEEGESKATEGGRGSGRKGHQKWMLGAEADPEECPNCMIFTEKKNGNCQICGNSY